MKIPFSILCMATSLITFSRVLADPEWETRPIGLGGEDETSEWWIETWHMGDTVPMESRYLFEGKLCIHKHNLSDVRWYESAKRFLEVEQAVSVEGIARSTTSVLAAPKRGSNKPTQLLREFDDCNLSARAVAVKGKRDGLDNEKSVRKAINAVYEELRSPEGREATEAVIKLLGEIAGDAAYVAMLKSDIEQGRINPDQGKGKAAKDAANRLTKWACRIGKKYGGKTMHENAETLVGARFESYDKTDIRGTEAKLGCPLFKKLEHSEAEQIKNAVLTLNDLFDGCRLYLASTAGNPILVKRLGYYGDGRETEANPVFCSGCSDLESLHLKMEELKLTPMDSRLSQIFARETLDVNATLFDMRKRAIGDVWRADASLLNNFLHPDLEGKFTGSIFLKYIGDELQSVSSFPHDNGRVFDCRHLVMLPRYQGGRSWLSYKEPGFHMDYHPDKQDTAVSIWMDKATGHVVKVEVRMDGNVAALPNLALLKGFSLYDSSGEIHFEMTAEAAPKRSSAKSK